MIPAHTFVGAEDAPKLAFVLHGVLGAGHNFRSFIKKLSEARPEYRFALIDLRHHGKSLNAPPPNTMATCAADLADLIVHLGRAPHVVLGHSMGGKVAVSFGKALDEGAYASAVEALTLPELRQIWTLDSDPGAQIPGENHQVRRVVGALKANPGPFVARADAVNGIMKAGLSSGLANWLVTNLERDGEQLVWKLDLEAIGDLLDDYFSLDLWPYLEELAHEEQPAPRHPEYHLLVAENSDRWSGSVRERADALPRGERFRLHDLPDAGHWVHVDNPEGLLKILAEHLD